MLVSILVFVAVLSVLVLIHELGHFLVAKKNGILVEEFGFGLPPRIFGKKIGETIYSINLLPFGGFVRLHGELVEDGISDSKRAFMNKSKRVRIAVVVAGVVMNFILSVVAFAVVYSFTGVPKEIDHIKVIAISPDSPALEAKILVGDIIKRADGKEFKKVSDFISYVDGKKGKKIVLEVNNGRKINITPRVKPPEGQGPLGVSITTTEVYYSPIWQRPFYGIYYGFKDSIFWGKNVLLGFYNIFKDLFSGKVPEDVSGPVGVFAVTTEAYKAGWIPLVNLLGIISVNLAILNIIPFPALDGGRLLFILIEGVVGKKVLPKIENTIHTVGMVILLGLILLITISDVRKLVSAGSISNFINSFVK